LADKHLIYNMLNRAINQEKIRFAWKNVIEAALFTS